MTNLRRKPWIALALSLLTFFRFWAALDNDFVSYDDSVYVTVNPMVQGGLSHAGIQWAFTTGHAGNWHPLTWLSHQADVELHGLKASGHHLTSLLLHCANVALLFLLLQRWTGALWRSVLVAALFALHPLRVESVAWVAERKDVLCGCFFLLSLLAYTRYVSGVRCQLSADTARTLTSPPRSSPSPAGTGEGGRRPGEGRGEKSNQSGRGKGEVSKLRPTSNLQPPSWPWYWLAVLGFALALMSKPMAVTLPFVLLLLDFWPIQRIPGDWCQVSGKAGSGMRNAEQSPPSRLRSRPSLAGAGEGGRRPGEGRGEKSSQSGREQGEVSKLVLPLKPLLLEKLPFFALAIVSCVITFIVQQRGGAMTSAASLPERLSNAVVAYGRYLAKTVWPENLAVFYPYPSAWPMEWVVGSAIALLAISGFALWQLKSRPAFAVGWFWFLGMLVPTIGLVQVGGQSLADRYTYLPQIGLFIAVVFAWPVRPVIPSSWRWGIATAALCILAALAWQTARQISFWHDSEALFRHALAVTERNEVAHNNLGVALQIRGEWAAAAEQHTAAIQVKPWYADAHMNLGNCLMQLGEPARALEHLRTALELAPNARAHHNLGTTLLKLGQHGEAREHLRQAVSLDPSLPEAQLNLGVVETALGDPSAGARACESALQLRPDWPEAVLHLGTAYAAQRDFARAAEAFTRAVRLNDRDLTARFNLANALVELGRFPEAIIALEQVLILNPNDADTRQLLADTYLRTGNVAGALGQLDQLVRSSPSPARHLLYAQGLLAAGRRTDAMQQYRAVIDLQPANVTALNDLAWLLATHPDATVRNGVEAATLGEKACELTQKKNPLLLGTLAAAYAEAGRFADAIAAADEAIALAKAAGLLEIAQRNEELLKRYRANQPFHEPAN